MLNKEKYAKEILDMACSGNRIAKLAESEDVQKWEFCLHYQPYLYGVGWLILIGDLKDISEELKKMNERRNDGRQIFIQGKET